MVINVLVPIYHKKIVDTFSYVDDQKVEEGRPWHFVVIWISLKLLQGGGIGAGKMTATDEEVENAAKLADIHETIMEFTNGYSTLVGERGLKLSGGEKQRVAIARTLLKDPSVMIFDEATSSLDSNTERNIQTSIDRASRERTTLVVAHRLSTITRAHQILVLEQGKVVEKGSHADLLLAGGKYAELWEHQNQEQPEEVAKETLTN